MKMRKSLLVLIAVLSCAVTLQASKPIGVYRERFANDPAIKLDFEAQEQMQKGELASAERTVELALRTDPTLWLTYYMRGNIFLRQHKY